MSGTHGVGLRGDLVALESTLVFLTYHMDETGNSSALCNLLMSLAWLHSCEEEETFAVLPHVAVALLAKNYSSQELPGEIIVGKERTEVCREPTVAEHPTDQQLGKCCPQPLSHLHHGTVGTVFTLQRSKTDGDFISPEMHMPLSPLFHVSSALCSLTFLSHSTCTVACSSLEKTLSCLRLACCLAKPAFQR